MNAIEDARFAILGVHEDELTSDGKKVIDLVANTFGGYSGKMLERIAHVETHWIITRKGYAENIPSNKVISMESIILEIF